MKNIAIYCDGTWQDFGQPDPTNVARLARASLRSDRQGAPQLLRYDDGVGVGHGVLDKATRLIGGVFGKGLNYKIARSYEFLCLNYEPGDRIFLFGFSRGAYTVRSLAGLLRQIWILRPEETGRVGEALDLYRKRPLRSAPAAATDAWTRSVLAFHRRWCRPIKAFTEAMPYEPGDPNSLAPSDPQACGWIQYIGAWDTVGSLGVPARLPCAGRFDRKYRFHDLKLSRFVRSARHAVSLDERRRSFEPALWRNLAGLNDNADGGLRAYDERPYQQQWFPGDHGGVGGGGASSISLAPLLWIAEGAARAGLRLDPDQVETYVSAADAEAAFDPPRVGLGAFLIRLIGSRWRTGPTDFDEISLAARLRVRGLEDYRPRSLTAETLGALARLPSPHPVRWYAP